MEEEFIREVETDAEGRVLVTIEEAIGSVEVPQVCAGCLGAPTRTLFVSGALGIDFPYCDACAPRRESAGPRRVLRLGTALLVVVALAFFVSWWFLILGFFVLMGLSRTTGGSAVELLLSEGRTVRLAFTNPEYAQRFLRANGASGDLPQGA